MDSKTPYIASLTREPFMYYEMKITAKLLEEGLSEEDVFVNRNLYHIIIENCTT